MSLLQSWTIGRATGLGVVAGLAATILWPLHAGYPDSLYWPFLASLGLTAFCGLSILILTAYDLTRHKRGATMRRIRAFDIVLGLLLAVPSLMSLQTLLPG